MKILGSSGGATLRPTQFKRPRWFSRLALRSILYVLCVSALGILGDPSLHAATAVDARQYGLVVHYQRVSQMRLSDGRHGLEVQLSVRNGGPTGLYDLRIALGGAGALSVLSPCEPARLTRLDPGTQAQLSWTFDCLLRSEPDTQVKELQFRVEAIDVTSGQIVAFTILSREGR